MTEGGKKDTFEISTRDSVRRAFKAPSTADCDHWVNAINTAIKIKSIYRRETLNNISFLNSEDGPVPAIGLVSLKQPSMGEVVLAKKGEYGGTLNVPSANPDATVVFNFANGGTAEIPVKMLAGKKIGESFNIKIETQQHIAQLVLNVEKVEGMKKVKKSFLGGWFTADTILPTLVILASVGFGIMEAEYGYLTQERLVVQVLTLLLFLKGFFSVHKKKRAVAKAPKPVPPVTIFVEDYRILRRDSDSKEEIPKRFMDGCFGDPIEALRRWEITKQWRHDFKTDEILEMEHPFFDEIKETLPHYYCMTGLDGNPVYIERSGQADLVRAKKIGVELMVWHYVYTTEYLYKYLHPSESAKTITIFDVEGE